MAPVKKISLSEEELVNGLKKQDVAAMNALYSMYSGALLGVISRVVINTEIAEDLLQETFVKIWNSAAGYDASKGRLFTWMMNIARNLSIDKLRSKDYKNTNKNQDIENNVDFIDEQKKVTFNADTLGLKDLVTNLKPDFKNVLDMVYFKGYTHAVSYTHLDVYKRQVNHFSLLRIHINREGSLNEISFKLKPV